MPDHGQAASADRSAILQLVLESIDQGISLIDADLNVVAFNRRFVEILGFPQDLFHPGDRFEKFIRYNAERGEYGPGDIEQQVRARLDFVRRLESHFLVRTRPDGTAIEIRGTPVEGGGFLTTYTDITERRRRELALRQSEERYALATQAVAEGIYDWNIETGEIYYSPRVQSEVGLARDELGSIHAWLARIHPDDAPRYRAAMIAHLQGKTERFELDYRYRTKDGGWRWARQHGFALRNALGRAIRMAGSAGDITHQKELEQALLAAKSQLHVAIESVSAGIALFDAKDRLILCNSHYREAYPELVDVIRPGTTFEKIILTAAERGVAVDARGRVEDWARERLAHHRNPSGPFLQRKQDGRWMQIDERSTRDGGMVGVFTDVTELKSREEALAQALSDKDELLSEFNAVMDTIDYGILFLGPDFRVRMANRAFREMWGFARDDLLGGQHFVDLMRDTQRRGLYGLSEEAFEAFVEQRLALMRQADVPPMDLERADGRVCQLQVKRLENGGLMWTYFDITERKRAERTIRESEQRFKDFASATSDWFWEMGPDLRFTYFSDPMEGTSKRAISRTLGLSRQEIANADPADSVWLRHQADLEARRPFKDFRYSFKTDHGTAAWITVSGLPVFDERGYFRGYRGTSSDITEEVLREQELREAKDKAEQALSELCQAQTSLIHAEKLALLGQLVAGIAHEIKNPLNFVNNFASLSKELLDEIRVNAADCLANSDPVLRTEIDELFDMLSGNLEKIRQHGARADGIVKSMLAHSREGPGASQETDINALVEESLNLAYHGARAADQSFNVTLERDLDPAAGTVTMVPQDITRVLLNLFSNGFHATHQRRRRGIDPAYRPTIRVATRRQNDMVEIRVRDNGIGMPPAVLEKIFTPFFTTKPAGEGTGLGLSLSYDIIVHQHGGALEVDSREGSHTELVIRLPATMPRGAAS